MQHLKISIIVPAHNEEDVIHECLDALLNEEYELKEIIVVNDGSTDHTKEIVEGYRDKVKLINFKKGHSAAFARNRGAEIATGDLLIFVDADMLISEGFLNRIAKDYKKYKFKFAGINVKSKVDNIISKHYALERAQFPIKIPKEPCFIERDNIQYTSFAFVFDKEFFHKIGGYSETIFYYEDADLTMRCFEGGDKMFLNPEWVVYHKEPSTLRETFKQGFYKGKASIVSKNVIAVIKCFFHPISIVLIFPYLIFSFMRTAKEFRISKDLKASVISNFVVKPVKGFGMAYGVMKNMEKW